MKLHFMVVRRVPPVPSPILVETYKILEERGYEVESTIAEEILQSSDEIEPALHAARVARTAGRPSAVA